MGLAVKDWGYVVAQLQLVLITHHRESSTRVVLEAAEGPNTRSDISSPAQSFLNSDAR